MMKEQSQKKERVCANCRYVKYYGAGIWLCIREKKDLATGVPEVVPLWKGCEWWEEKEDK
jgi:ribosomal protein L37AE/L43A